MELLIPGLLLVALMVYASTKIKRTVAEAFEHEHIETDDYVLEKPEGFLNVLNRDSSLELDIYSKESGVDDAASFKVARAELRIYAQRTIDYAANALAESVKIGSSVSEIVDGRKYRVLEAESSEKGVEFRELYKLTEKHGRVFELKLQILENAGDELSRKADQMFTSFEVK